MDAVDDKNMIPRGVYSKNLTIVIDIWTFSRSISNDPFQFIDLITQRAQ